MNYRHAFHAGNFADVVKHVLLRHRARLEISSVLGHGSTFTCHFAAAQVVQRVR